MSFRTIDIPDDNGYTRHNRIEIKVPPITEDAMAKFETCQFPINTPCQMLIDPSTYDKLYCTFHAQIIERMSKK